MTIKVLLLLTYLQLFQCVIIDFMGDITFFLYTKNLGKYPQVLFLNDYETLQLSNFKSSRKTIFLIHEWGTGQRSIHTTPIKNEYLKLGNVNIIVIDWYNEAMMSYVSARKMIEPIGNFIAKFLQFLIDAEHAKASDFHIIGYGLGAHIAGCIARQLKNIHKITALNPETNLFYSKDIDILKPSDAKCVYIFYSFGYVQTNEIISKMGNALFLVAPNGTEFNLGKYYAQLSSIKTTILKCNSLAYCMYATYHHNGINNIKYSETEQNCVKGYFYLV